MKCPECLGSGVYVGLNTREVCARCKGKGEIGPEVVDETWSNLAPVALYNHDDVKAALSKNGLPANYPFTGFTIKSISPPDQFGNTASVSKGGVTLLSGGPGGISIGEAMIELDTVLGWLTPRGGITITAGKITTAINP